MKSMNRQKTQNCLPVCLLAPKFLKSADASRIRTRVRGNGADRMSAREQESDKTLSGYSGCLPWDNLSISIMFVFLSVKSNDSSFAVPAHDSIHLPVFESLAVSFLRAFMVLTRPGMFLTSVVRSGRQWAASSSVPSARMCRYMSSWEMYLPRHFMSAEICSGDQLSSLIRSKAFRTTIRSFVRDTLQKLDTKLLGCFLWSTVTNKVFSSLAG